VAAFAADAPVLVELSVDDQDHTAEWLRSGAVLAAVTGTARPPAGFNSRPLGAMRYLAAASPAYVARHFRRRRRGGQPGAGAQPGLQHEGRPAGPLGAAPVPPDVELPRHAVPSAHAFVTAAVAGMGWGLQPAGLIAPSWQDGLAGRTGARHPLDVPLYWQHARAASSLIDGLSHRAELVAIARRRGMTDIRVFGSMSRGEANDNSDVDLLVTLAPGTSALALGGLLLDAQELLGRRVDVVTEPSLHPALRDRVLSDAVLL
jgi:LysR family transcriptional regulator (chromosome initiation inhibitor)